VRPLQQEGRDRLVEHLVWGARWADQVVVDLAQRHRREDGLPGWAVAPGRVVDQQAALSLEVALSHPTEELPSRCATERLAGEDQRDLLTYVREPGELRFRFRR